MVIKNTNPMDPIHGILMSPDPRPRTSESLSSLLSQRKDIAASTFSPPTHYDMQPPVRVYLIRHGETDANRNGIMQGQLDTALNANGWAQAQAVAQSLRDVPFAKAFSSDAQRASNTAKKILEFHPGVVLEERTALRERYWGELEGQKLAFVRTQKPPASAESVNNVISRALQWWDEEVLTLVPATPTRATTTVLMVSHGALINTLLLTGLIQMRGYRRTAEVKRGTLYNTAVCILDVAGRKDGEGELVTYANVAHLADVGLVVRTNVDEAQGRKDKEETGTK